MTHLFCFGLGYSAAELARRLCARGWMISGTARSAEAVARLGPLGYRGIVFDGLAPGPDVAAVVRAATHILISAPPDAGGDTVLRHHAADIAAAPSLAWIGYLSTVGVYGDHGGAAVDEETEPRPVSQRSRRRLAAENDWLAFGRRTGKPGRNRK